MASGEVVAQILAISEPVSSGAAPGSLLGGATPGELIPYWAFAADSIEYIDLYCVLHGYDNGGLTVRLKWGSPQETSGNVIWGAAFRAAPDDAEDLNTTAHSYDFNDTGAVAAPSATTELSYDNITFTNGADMDSVADGEYFILRVRRNGSSGSDTMLADAYLFAVTITET